MQILVGYDDGHRADGLSALEAALTGTATAIAVSLAGPHPSHYASAARVSVDPVTRHRGSALRPHMLSNVNVPDTPSRQGRVCA